MGCTNSKDDELRRRGGEHGIRPLPRCFSTPAEKEASDHDYHRLGSLRSPAYGNPHVNMNQEDYTEDYFPRKQEYPEGFYDRYRQNFERSSNVAAKTWSEVNTLLSDYHKQENPNAHHRQQTEPEDPEEEQEEEEEEEGEMETINTWELMEGLEEENELSGYVQVDGYGNTVHGLQAKEAAFPLENARKPLWMHFQDDNSDALFDPDIVSGFREALGNVSTGKEGSAASGALNEVETPVSACSRGSSRFRCNSFPRPINKSPFRKPDLENQPLGSLRAPPGGEDRVVLYFTSLRAIRKTYEDCGYVRLILQGFRIFVDERDVSLHAEYKEELQRLMGSQRISVPMLFVRGECIGGADMVIQLHEEGELEKYFEGFPVQTCVRVCDGCGDLRFVPCLTCHGSCKYYTDEDELIRCPDCNENGLIRCPLCIEDVLILKVAHEPDANLDG